MSATCIIVLSTPTPFCLRSSRAAIGTIRPTLIQGLRSPPPHTSRFRRQRVARELCRVLLRSGFDDSDSLASRDLHSQGIFSHMTDRSVIRTRNGWTDLQKVTEFSMDREHLGGTVDGTRVMLSSGEQIMPSGSAGSPDLHLGVWRSGIVWTSAFGPLIFEVLPRAVLYIGSLVGFGAGILWNRSRLSPTSAPDFPMDSSTAWVWFVWSAITTGLTWFVRFIILSLPIFG